MSNRGTVPAELSQGEVRELHSAVLQQFPDLSPDKGRYFIRHKSELGKLLRQAFADQRQSVSSIIVEWERFYRKYFGMKVDFSRVRIPDDPGGFERVLIISQGLTPERAFAACKAKFPAWKYAGDLDREVPTNERDPKNGVYAVRVRDRAEADEELAGRSADWIKEKKLATETLLERLIHELKFFDEIGKHLDVQNITLCAGSRSRGGSVPSADGDDGRFRLDWAYPGYSSSSIRARAVVS